ncbi:MAG: hypothetical protein ATN34_04215 [Epulopiscium sp. Nele67-Bin002]|nr:MAG: hypothetical protein ATN34_04215 [Epulopiscium sp. Nele67-Bin002]OON92665.1 MAG: hypothetical protein ATN33_06875 [Epulopiscium sp. Nele67-Bin001]
METVLVKVDYNREHEMDPFFRMHTLANQLTTQVNNLKVIFLCKDTAIKGINYLADRGFTIEIYNTEIELINLIKAFAPCNIIVDSRMKATVFEQACQHICKRVIYIIEGASRSYKADIVFNPAYGGEYSDYMVSRDCRVYSGSDYSLIRPEFLEKPLRELDDCVRTILVHLGELKSNNVTRDLLRPLQTLPYKFNVVLEDNIKGRSQIISHYESENINFFNSDDIINLVDNCDLVVTGCINLVHEAGALGLPIIVVALSKEPIRECQYMMRDRLVEGVGIVGVVAVKEIIRAIKSLANDYTKRFDMHTRILAVFNSHCNENVANKILELLNLW